jgi:hypothetical protein
MRLRRRHTLWLAVLTGLVGVVLVSGAAPPAVVAALVGLYLAAVIATTVQFDLRSVTQRVSPSPLALVRMSSQAREAAERARRRGSLPPPGVALLDIGLISLHASSEGMLMRRSRTISLDDSGVRPYITLNIAAQSADRNAIVRFEIVDQHGEVQFVHEMKAFLRDGEMNILADHHLPLSGNERLRAGDWDVRVFVDGALVGALGFAVGPSIEGRARQFGGSASERLIEVEEDSPVSLEDLLRAKSRSERS